MEAAAIAGTQAADIVAEHAGLSRESRLSGFRSRPAILWPLRTIDGLLYEAHLPNISILILLLLVILIAIACKKNSPKAITKY